MSVGSGDEDWDDPRWHDACWAAALFAVDPAGTGVALRALAGPVRVRWLALLRGLLPDGPIRTIPLNIADARLLGGLDLAATLPTVPANVRGALATLSTPAIFEQRLADTVDRSLAAESAEFRVPTSALWSVIGLVLFWGFASTFGRCHV